MAPAGILPKSWWMLAEGELHPSADVSLSTLPKSQYEPRRILHLALLPRQNDLIDHVDHAVAGRDVSRDDLSVVDVDLAVLHSD